MAKRAAPLPPKWQRFVARYATDLAYWYQPKGLAITSASVLERLHVLKEFEGQKWRDCQAGYIARLRDEGVSSAEITWDGGGAPLARMLKQVFITLGLAWVDGDDRVEISAAGNELLTCAEPDALLSLQALRYQFWNPCVGTWAHHGNIRIHPVPFLVRVLLAVGNTITNNEYILFVSRAKSPSEVENVADQILEYRELSDDDKKSIVQRCRQYMLGGTKRSTMYNTISLNRSYAFKMWSLSKLIYSDGTALHFNAKAYRGADRAYLETYAADSAYINFISQKEFFAWMSNSLLPPSKSVALDIYVERGDIESSILVKRSLGAATKEVSDFRKMLISEKTLEDNIESNLSIIGDAIGRKLGLVGRQYETTVGPIDLLVKDVTSGQLVVIELKKGRSADRVFGQLSRYMGWVRQNLAEGNAVSGVIVAATIDEKLKAAKAAHDTDVQLVRYSSQISATAV